MASRETSLPEAEVLRTVANHLIETADGNAGLERLADVLKEISASVQQRIALDATRISLEASPDSPTKKQVRILLPGCFDMMHAGHYNALRQAKAVCAAAGVQVTLVAGVHNDAAIMEQKGPTVFKDPERNALVTACKWVDEVAADLPYLITPELLDSLNCDFVAHGDDLPVRSDGTSVYGSVIEAGRFKLIKRTEGVSTTTLIGRLLSMSKDHLCRPNAPGVVSSLSLLDQHATMLPTMSRLSQFKGEGRPREDAKRVVYVDGAFDLFHIGHLAFLEKAKALGDYLLVGVHSDQVVHTIKGSNLPIQDLCERALCVLAMGCVDDVVVGAPWMVTQDLITSLGIDVVAAGKIDKKLFAERPDALPYPYTHAQEVGVFEEVESGSTITTETVIERILSQQEAYTKRNATRSVMEDKYRESKEYVTEK
jgi:ethanolamine-phosphate cytidylyltransferase